MKAGDLVKRKGKKWYALVLGFKKTVPGMGHSLPEGDTNYPIIMWTPSVPCFNGEVESCHRSCLEVISEVG